MNKLYDVAVVGATGLVGRKILEVLEKREFPVGKLVAFAGENSSGQNIRFRDGEIFVHRLTGESVIKNRVDLAFFSAGGETSKKFAPLFSALGSTVIDNSSAFRMEEHVPLVIPSVNPSDALMSDGIIANPNCSTIIALSALAPLHKKYGIKRVVYSTYQAVSGAGQRGIEALKHEMHLQPELPQSETDGSDTSKKAGPFPCSILGNVIPRIGEIMPSGYTAEEQKMIDETKKILGSDSIAVTATCVRVPVFYGHCISINAELNYSVSVSDVTNTLKDAGIMLADSPVPLEAAGYDEVFAGRIRRDFSHPNTFNLWIVSDNVLKGAALNAVQIAELLI